MKKKARRGEGRKGKGCGARGSHGKGHGEKAASTQTRTCAHASMKWEEHNTFISRLVTHLFFFLPVGTRRTLREQTRLT